LSRSGAQFDKIKLRFYSDGYRGVHAAKHVKAGSILLYIPKERLITIEMAMTTPIGRKMLKAGLRNSLFSPKHSFLTTFILTEIKKLNQSAWFPYIDILPKYV
jgi:hypothetical protein